MEEGDGFVLQNVYEEDGVKYRVNIQEDRNTGPRETGSDVYIEKVDGFVKPLVDCSLEEAAMRLDEYREQLPEGAVEDLEELNTYLTAEKL